MNLQAFYLRQLWSERHHLLDSRRRAFWRGIADRLPRTLVTYCGYRIVLHATLGEYGSTVVPELTAMEALNRWTEQ